MQVHIQRTPETLAQGCRIKLSLRLDSPHIFGLPIHDGIGILLQHRISKFGKMQPIAVHSRKYQHLSLFAIAEGRNHLASARDATPGLVSHRRLLSIHPLIRLGYSIPCRRPEVSSVQGGVSPLLRSH